MVEFERNWGEVSGKSFLYVRPKGYVSDEDWIRFFEFELDDYRDDVFRLLVDVIGIEENIGIKGFSRIAEILKERNVLRTRIAVLPSNSAYPALAHLFESVAKFKGLDLKVQLFEQRDAAEDWISSQ